MKQHNATLLFAWNRRYLTAHVSQENAYKRTRSTHFRAMAALEGQSSLNSPMLSTSPSPRPTNSGHDLTAAAVSMWSNPGSPMVPSVNINNMAGGGEDGQTPSKAENRRLGSKSLPTRRRQGGVVGGSGGERMVLSPVDAGVLSPSPAAPGVKARAAGAGDGADGSDGAKEPMSMRQLRELEKSLGMDEEKVCVTNVSLFCCFSCLVP